MNQEVEKDDKTLYWRDDDDDAYALSAGTLPTEHLHEASLMWEAISRTVRYHTTIPKNLLVRAFLGGEKSVQRDPFHIAIWSFYGVIQRKYGISIVVETMSTKTLAEKRLSPTQLMDWLLGAHVHFITAHAHQGLRSHALEWCMQDYVKQLQRLQFHVGFPSGDQVSCPVFTQDKYQYIRYLGDMVNNTYVVQLTQDGEYDNETLEEIRRFIEQNDESCGWVIKAPFTTNSECVKFAKSFERILYFLRSLSHKFYGLIPYLMIQACMHNRKEYKVVVLGGKPAYVASVTGSGNKRSADGTNRSFATSDILLEFSGRALERFVNNVPFAITDGLFRVDIFQTRQGKLVVNEFESLDANYDGEGTCESVTKTFLLAYWKKVIKAKLAECNLSID